MDKWKQADLCIDADNHLRMHAIHDVGISSLSNGDDESVLDSDISLQFK